MAKSKKIPVEPAKVRAKKTNKTSPFTLVIILTILFVASIIVPEIIFQAHFDMWDVGWYYKYAIQIFSGKIPYVDFPVEYPQLTILVIILPQLVAIAFNNPQMYVYAHYIFCSILYIATALMVYYIALHLYEREDRAKVAAFMTITAFSATYFVLTKYDAYPTFFMVLSLYIYISHKDPVKSYISSVVGFFLKWVSLIPLPFFVLRDIRKKDITIQRIFICLGVCAIMSLLILLPYLYPSMTSGNLSNLTYAYTYHTGRNAQTESIFFLFDTILNLGTLCSQIGNYIMIGSMGIVFYLYYRKNDMRYTTLLGYITFTVFMFVFFNKVASPQYILWFTPLFALILSRKVMHMVWFYVMQLWMFFEFPILFGTIADTAKYLMRTEAIVFFTVKFILWTCIAYIVWKEINR